MGTARLPVMTADVEISTLFDNCVQEIRMQSKEQDHVVAEWFNATQCKIMTDIEEQYKKILRVKEDHMLLPAWMFDSSKGLSIYTNDHPAALIHYCDVIQASLIRLLAQRGFDASIERVVGGNVIFYEVLIRFRDSVSPTPPHSNPTTIGSLLTAPSCSFPCTIYNPIPPQYPTSRNRENGDPHVHDSSPSDIGRVPVVEPNDGWSEGGDSAGQDYQSVLEEIPESEDPGADSPPTELGIMDHVFAIRHLILQRARAPIIHCFDLFVVAVLIGLIYLARGVRAHVDRVLFRLGLSRSE